MLKNNTSVYRGGGERALAPPPLAKKKGEKRGQNKEKLSIFLNSSKKNSPAAQIYFHGQF